jgi:hypothetical protein
MSFSSNNLSNFPSQNLSPPLHYHERPTVVYSPDKTTLRQIQQMAVHTTNIVWAILMFDPGNEANDSDEEWERWEQILHIAIQVFHNDDQAGDASPNILDSPPQAVCSHVLVTGQNDQAPQIPGGTILHGIVQVLGDDTNMHPLHNPENRSSSGLSTADVDQLLTIRNPEMQLAPFPEPDFLRLP